MDFHTNEEIGLADIGGTDDDVMHSPYNSDDSTIGIDVNKPNGTDERGAEVEVLSVEECEQRDDENAASGRHSNPVVDNGFSNHSGSVCSEIEGKLRVGSIVNDLEQVYLLYCEYGRCKGFGVRRGEQRYIGKTDDLRWKEYVCSSAGLPDCKSSRGRAPAYKKLVTRTGCKVKIRVSRVLGGPWGVTIFETTHNHPLLPIEQTYMLRSSRNLTYAKQSILEALHSVGIGVSGACGFMERESGGPQNVGFTRQDAYNHMKRTKRATKIENGDASALLEYFITKSNEEPFFYWKVQLDDESRIMNFFFRDSRCAHDYQAFGDILSVDTTYRTNRYNLSCAPFVGVNHHTFNVMFGMAFLSDETTSTFEWLFTSFLESMNGAQPKLIFSDQCVPMMNAIDKVFPESKHRLCQWHVNRNAASHFGVLNGDVEFKKMWHKCMNGVETEAEFEKLWQEMISSRNLSGNSWFRGMHKIRHRWASVFSNGVFTAGLHSTSRSEATNRVLKFMQRSSSSLYEFVRNYEDIQNRWRTKEVEEDTLGLWVPGQFISNNPLLMHAATVFTRYVYKAFELEVTRSLNVVLAEERRDLGDGNLEFRATTALAARSRKVLYNLNTDCAFCSCRMWETDGIFCRHILKVYYVMNVFAIPDSQIVKRWTKLAKDGCLVYNNAGPMRPTLPFMVFVKTVMRHLYEMAGSAVDNEAARSLIKERILALRQDVDAIVGLPETKSRRKVKCEITNKENWYCFSDPKPVREQISKKTQKNDHWGAAKREGSSKSKRRKKEFLDPRPREPCKSQDDSTTPSSCSGQFSPEWVDVDRHFYCNFIQPSV